jgi:hypothetical protein
MDYTYDRDGISAYLKTSPELRAELWRRAELGLTVARALAPVFLGNSRIRVPGTLQASGHVEDGGIGGFGDSRMQVSIVFDPTGTNNDGYGAAGTYQHQPGGVRNKNIDYLIAAIPMIERG